MQTITFVVFTYNEARRIEYVLRCFQPYGKILIMDNHSTDNTVEIAKKYGAEVHLHTWDGATHAENERTANNVLSKITTPWAYWAYADELLTKSLLQKLVEISCDEKKELVNIYRKNLHYGIENLNFDSFGVRSPRFFRKGSVDFTKNPIHSMGRYIGKPNAVVNLPMQDKYAIYHCSTYNINKFEAAHCRYSEIEAQSLFERETKCTFKMLVIRPIYLFLKFYFIGGGRKHGYAGLIMIMQYFFYFFNVYAKLWEKQAGITLETIESNYDVVKDKLLQ